jgi:hypothetical protein
VRRQQRPRSEGTLSGAPEDRGLGCFPRAHSAWRCSRIQVRVGENGQVPGTGGKPETLEADAKVLSVDPSYRLLKPRPQHT